MHHWRRRELLQQPDGEILPASRRQHAPPRHHAAGTHHHSITPPARTRFAISSSLGEIRRPQPSTREDISVVLQIRSAGHNRVRVKTEVLCCRLVAILWREVVHSTTYTSIKFPRSRKTSPCRMSSQMILCFISISAPLP